MTQVKQSSHAPARADKAEGAVQQGTEKTPAPRNLAALTASSPLQRARAAKGLHSSLGNARLGKLMAAPLQRQERLEDEEPLQRRENLEEDELQMRAEPGTLQRERPEDEELLQGKMAPVQRQEKLEEEEPLQGQFKPTQRQTVAAAPENRTGIPDRLKVGLEQLSGTDLSGLRVHRNSPKPAQLNALAYAQGQDIHLAPGQEQHLPHEGWHAVQQMQGRVRPTIQAQGVAINDDEGLEREADVMGAKALQMRGPDESGSGAPIHQRTECADPVSRWPGALPSEVSDHHVAEGPDVPSSRPIQRLLTDPDAAARIPDIPIPIDPTRDIGPYHTDQILLAEAIENYDEIATGPLTDLRLFLRAWHQLQGIVRHIDIIYDHLRADGLDNDPGYHAFFQEISTLQLRTRLETSYLSRRMVNQIRAYYSTMNDDQLLAEAHQQLPLYDGVIALLDGRPVCAQARLNRLSLQEALARSTMVRGQQKDKQTLAVSLPVQDNDWVTRGPRIQAIRRKFPKIFPPTAPVAQFITLLGEGMVNICGQIPMHESLLLELDSAELMTLINCVNKRNYENKLYRSVLKKYRIRPLHFLQTLDLELTKLNVIGYAIFKDLSIGDLIRLYDIIAPIRTKVETGRRVYVLKFALNVLQEAAIYAANGANSVREFVALFQMYLEYYDVKSQKGRGTASTRELAAETSHSRQLICQELAAMFVGYTHIDLEDKSRALDQICALNPVTGLKFASPTSLVVHLIKHTRITGREKPQEMILIARKYIQAAHSFIVDCVTHGQYQMSHDQTGRFLVLKFGKANDAFAVLIIDRASGNLVFSTFYEPPGMASMKGYGTEEM